MRVPRLPCGPPRTPLVRSPVRILRRKSPAGPAVPFAGRCTLQRTTIARMQHLLRHTRQATPRPAVREAREGVYAAMRSLQRCLCRGAPEAAAPGRSLFDCDMRYNARSTERDPHRVWIPLRWSELVRRRSERSVCRWRLRLPLQGQRGRACYAQATRSVPEACACGGTRARPSQAPRLPERTRLTVASLCVFTGAQA